MSKIRTFCQLAENFSNKKYLKAHLAAKTGTKWIQHFLLFFLSHWDQLGNLLIIRNLLIEYYNCTLREGEIRRRARGFSKKKSHEECRLNCKITSWEWWLIWKFRVLSNDISHKRGRSNLEIFSPLQFQLSWFLVL